MNRNRLCRMGSVVLAAVIIGTGTAAAEETALVRGGAVSQEEKIVLSEESRFAYEIYEDHVEITKYTGTETEVVIPEEIEKLPVTVLGPGVFEKCMLLQKVVIGRNVAEIASRAFAECISMTEIHIPYNVERISNDSFEDTGLRRVSGREDSIAPVLADYLGVEYVKAEDAWPEEESEAETEAPKVESEPETETPEDESEAETEVPEEKNETETEATEEESETVTEAPEEENEKETEASGEESGTQIVENQLSQEVKDGFIFPDSDQSSLDPAALSGLPAQLLIYGKYEIYARSGMLFRSEELTGYFGEKSWYFGFIDEESFPENMLSDTARENLQVLEQLIAASGSDYQLDQPGYSYDAVYAFLAGEDGNNAAMQEEAAGETEILLTEDAEEETSERILTEETEEESAERILTEEAEEETAESMQTEAVMAEFPQTEAGLSLEGNSDIEADIMGSTGAGETGEVLAQAQNSGTSEYIFPDVASRYLNRSEVEALSLQAICYAKNEVYAMHGRKFRSIELQEYFASKSWYFGMIEPDEFSDKVFNDFERQNIQLLVSCEEAIRSDGYQLDQPGYDIRAVGTASKYDNPGTMTDEQYLLQNFIFEDSDVRSLSEEEIRGLSFKVVSYAAYEIYARRGCIFESQEIQNHFSQKPWYSGKIRQEDFSQDLFNSIEKSNLELLKSRRKELQSQ